MSFIERFFLYSECPISPISMHWDQPFFSFIERLSPVWRLKCTSIIEKSSKSVLYREVFFFIQSVLFRLYKKHTFSFIR